MTQEEKDVDVLVIGAGFAALACASRLGLRAMVIDRGDIFDAANVRSNLGSEVPRTTFLSMAPNVEAEARAHRSGLAGNRVALPLSGLTSNQYAYRMGGISNWWGGYSPRITAETFSFSGSLEWPFKGAVLDTHYQQAERLLRVHGDPERTDATVYGAMPGWREWKEFLRPVFSDVHITSEAKNITGPADHILGLCTGNGHCAVCPNDAKARPGNIFSEITVHRAIRVEELIFSGRKVVAARCETEGEEFVISCATVVLAAGGLENVGLLNRSRLPADSNSHLVGQRYQDHTAAEIVGILPRDIPFFQVGAEAHVEIPALSGYIHGVEVKTLMLTIPANGSLLDRSMAASPGVSPHRMARFYLQLEIPPEWGLSLRSRGDRAFISTAGYVENVAVFNAVVDTVSQRMRDLGVMPVHVEPFYRSGFGGHHYSGTTPMSLGSEDAVVDSDQRLIGSDNLYVAGASVLPRCGGAGPTLSLTAMSLRLGDHIASV